MEFSNRYYRNTINLLNKTIKYRNTDLNYEKDRINLSSAYNLLIKDMIVIFEYVHPCKGNLDTYSHRIYELFLRASTEFEANCKAFLIANGYKSSNKDFTIRDYSKIEIPAKLSNFVLKHEAWKNEFEVSPFSDFERSKIVEDIENWKVKENGYFLSWYQDYNDVKHNRSNNFKKANLRNLLNAISAVACLLYSQFGLDGFVSYYDPLCSHGDDEGFEYNSSTFFHIKPPIWEVDSFE